MKIPMSATRGLQIAVWAFWIVGSLAHAGSDTTPRPSDAARAASTPLPDLAKLPKSSREMLLTMDGRTPGPDFSSQFEKSVARIVMRDGVALYTEIYTPRDRKGLLPIIFDRTPYGINPDRYGYTGRLRLYPELIKEGFIFAFQDVRGKGGSGGQFITLGPIRDKSIRNSTDDSTDAYDSIDWLVKHVPGNNGRVGTLGISYGGFATTRSLVDPHPALRAASPQATCADMFVGDDWHHNGAFRLDYSFDWITDNERDFDRTLLTSYDHYERFMALGPLSNINRKILRGVAPSWNAFEKHPNLDAYWLKDMCGVLPFIQPVTVPTLNVLGWFDAEDFYGAFEVYKKYESMDKKGLNYLVIGPWYHGGWSFSADGRTLGAVDFGSNTSEWFRNNVQARWFAFWLKDKGKLDFPKVIAFRTGENKWEQYPEWPPQDGIEPRSLYLREGKSLTFEAPKPNGLGVDSYISDPDSPVPYYPRPITSDGWPEWEMADQRFADGRPDVLTYKTGVLTKDVTVSGDPVAHLFAATTGSDSDWVVKLIDVYPDPLPENPSMSGFQFMVAEEVFRARYRKSYEHPEAVVPSKVTPYVISLRSRNHTFKAGHRIMVQIQSTWFPLIDRNPQTFVPSIYQAVQADFHKATQSIYRSGANASYIELPVNTRPVNSLPGGFTTTGASRTQ